MATFEVIFTRKQFCTVKVEVETQEDINWAWDMDLFEDKISALKWEVDEGTIDIEEIRPSGDTFADYEIERSIAMRKL